MWTKNITVFLVLLLTFSCSEKINKQETLATNDQAQQPKKLDTSFLSLGAVGTQTVTAQVIEPGNRIHVLNSDQVITIENSHGEIKIANFDYTQLKDGHIIVGNQEDRYLFKYDEQGSQGLSDAIKVKQATFADLEEDVNVDVNFTPELIYQASEGKSFDKQQTATNLPQTIKADGKDLNPDKKNILSFKNYEIINTKKQSLASFNSLAFNQASLDGGDLVVSIDEGYIEMIPTFQGKYDVSGLRRMDLMATFNTYLKYRFQVTVETSEATEGTLSFPLFKDITIPVRAMAGTVPIYVDLTISFPAGFKVYSKEKGKVTFTVENEYALNAVANYNASTGANYDDHYDYLVNQQKISILDGDAHYAFEVFFEPKVETKMYKVFGPYAYLNTNVQTDIKLPLEDDRDDLFLNFSGGIGLNVDDPIFGGEAFSLRSESLYNFSKGWDILGPVKGNKSAKSLNTLDNVSLTIDELSDDGSVAIRLKPTNASILTQVSIHSMPEFGKLVLGDNFAIDGIAYYYPPQVIEGRDSFQIITQERGYKSAPTRITLDLSSRAKEQAENPIDLLPRFGAKRATPTSSISVGNMIVGHVDRDFIIGEDIDEVAQQVHQIKEHKPVFEVDESKIYKTYAITSYTFNRRSFYSEQGFNKYLDQVLFELVLKQTEGNQMYLKLVPTKLGRELLENTSPSTNDPFDLRVLKNEYFYDIAFMIEEINAHFKSKYHKPSFFQDDALNEEIDHIESLLEHIVFESENQNRVRKNIIVCLSNSNIFLRKYGTGINEEALRKRSWNVVLKRTEKKINYCIKELQP